MKSAMLLLFVHSEYPNVSNITDQNNLFVKKQK